MHKIIFSAAIAAALFISCNSNEGNKGNHENHNATTTENKTTTEASTSPQTTDTKTVKPQFTSLDANVSGHIKNVFNHYIHVKTALVNSNAAEAQSGANMIVKAIDDFDRSFLPAEQKGAYDKGIGGIKTNAKAISASTDIKKQREHFAQLSNNAYELAKSFGAGKTLYHDHCPMAFNNKGALWLSEQKEIKNPYYGKEMLECGTVEEVIQ